MSKFYDIAEPVDPNQDLLSEQLRLFEEAKNASTSAAISEAGRDKLPLNETRKFNAPRKVKVPANVAIALAAFVAGVIFTSLVWLSDLKVLLFEKPPQTALEPLGPDGAAKQEVRLAANDPCALSDGPQAGRAPVTPNDFYRATKPMLVRVCPPFAIWFNGTLTAGSAAIASAGNGGETKVRQDLLLGAGAKSSTGFSNQNTLSFDRGREVGSSAKLGGAVSLARANPDESDHIAVLGPPQNKPKVKKAAAKNNHHPAFKPAPLPPGRPEQQSASLFSEVSNYLSRILPK